MESKKVKMVVKDLLSTDNQRRRRRHDRPYACVKLNFNCVLKFATIHLLM